MKTLGIVWNIIVNLITLFVILAVFGTASSKFEKIELSLLVLIYIQITSGAAVWSRMAYETLIAIDDQFYSIKKLIKPEIDLEEYKEAKQKLKDSATKFWINMAFIFIFYVIGIFNILTNL